MIMSQDERWLTPEEATAVVRNRVRGSIGLSERILKDARLSGEVRVRAAERPVLLTTDDGIIDFNLRPGALNAGGGPNGRYKLESETISEDDLLDWLGRNHPATSLDKLAGTSPRAASKIEAAKEGIAACFPEGLQR